MSRARTDEPERREAARSSGGARLGRRVLTLALAGALTLLVYDAARTSGSRASLRTAVVEANKLHEALGKYRALHGKYPESGGELGLARDTLDPLRRRGYYDGRLTKLLEDSRLDAYVTIDDGGDDREYWLEMTLADVPGVRLIVADSDDALAGGGEWLDGVYVQRRGRLEPR